MSVGSARVLCRASGALWIEDVRALVVADLHFEKGSAFARRGQLLPPYDTPETLKRLAAEVDALSPRLVVFLGDSFHDGEGEARLSADDERAIRGIASGRTLVWLAGNHDAEGPRRLPGDRAEAVTLAGLALVHEPGEGETAGEAAGHLHPCAKVRGRGGSVRRRCFVTDGRRLVLPAFGSYAGGLNVRHAAFAPLFERRPLAAVLGPRRVHPIAWSSLRDD
jgi:hypothetical protein